MKKTIETMLIAACCAIAGGRLLAADLFWYGNAGDGLWNTPANWSTTVGTWDYDAVASKTESDWMPWDGTAGVMGLAVKIVGSPSGLAIFVR